MVDSTNTWITDSLATNHVYNMLQGFRVIRELNEGEHTLSVGTRAVVFARVVGNIYLYFSIKNI